MADLVDHRLSNVSETINAKFNERASKQSDDMLLSISILKEELHKAELDAASRFNHCDRRIKSLSDDLFALKSQIVSSSYVEAVELAIETRLKMLEKKLADQLLVNVRLNDQVTTLVQEVATRRDSTDVLYRRPEPARVAESNNGGMAFWCVLLTIWLGLLTCAVHASVHHLVELIRQLQIDVSFVTAMPAVSPGQPIPGFVVAGGFVALYCLVFIALSHRRAPSTQPAPGDKPVEDQKDETRTIASLAQVLLGFEALDAIKCKFAAGRPCKVDEKAPSSTDTNQQVSARVLETSPIKPAPVASSSQPEDVPAKSPSPNRVHASAASVSAPTPGMCASCMSNEHVEIYYARGETGMQKPFKKCSNPVHVHPLVWSMYN